MSGYEYVSMSLNEFLDFVANCNDIPTLNRAKQQLDSVIKYVTEGYNRKTPPPVGHPLNLIDLGERRQTVADRWIALASHSAA